MKITKFMILIAAAIIVCSCAKDVCESSEMAIDTKVVQEELAEILSFGSIEEMEMQIYALQRMSDNELSAWYAERNFESQYDALYRAAKEIDEAKSLDEALAIKAKFVPYFLYNDNPADEEMFNPYLPNENRDYAYVCNIEGDVMIAGRIVNYNTITDAKNTHEYQMAHDIATRASDPNITETNILKRTVGKRKFWAEGRLNENEVVAIEFTAHKKGTFGWNKYKTAYFVKVVNYNRSWESFSPDFVYYINSGKNGLWTREIPSHTLLPVGRLRYKQTATMDLYIYSRGTGEAGAGILSLR